MSMDPQLALRIQELSLGGRASRGQAETPTKGSKTAQLIALGWRILPIPEFRAAGHMWHDDKGNGNPAIVDFAHPREWLVIPPDDMDLRAQKVNGRICAIRWAWKQAKGEEQP